MKVFKLNEGWDDNGFGPADNVNITNNTSSGQPWAASGYLINRDTENLNIVTAFCRVFNLEEKVLTIYNYDKDHLNSYPNKITSEELLYFSKEESPCRVIISIENGLVTTIKKEKTLYEQGKGFTKKVIDEGPFSIEKLKYLMETT